MKKLNTQIIFEAGGILMNVLVVGGGAREHVICDAVTQSENVNLFSVMKNLNPGI